MDPVGIGRGVVDRERAGIEPAIITISSVRPAASSTASSSRSKAAGLGSQPDGSGSELLVPSRSYRTTVPSDASRVRNNAAPGSSQATSVLVKVPAEATIVGGPSPNTWYAMRAPSTNTYRVTGCTPRAYLVPSEMGFVLGDVTRRGRACDELGGRVRIA